MLGITQKGPTIFKAMNTHTMTVWDCETGPETDERLALAEPAFEAPANYKDPEKIAASIAEQRAKWKERAALDPMTGRILAIGSMDEVTIVCDHGENREADIIGNFFRVYERHASCGERMVGFNIRSFDLPFIVRRAFITGVPVPPQLKPNGQSTWFKFPETFIDLRDIWLCSEKNGHGSLGTLCKLMGLGEKTGSGADFARLYADESTRQQALDYLKNDLLLTSKLAERLLQ